MRPLDVRTLASEVELHQNTVRDHLELMHRAGLIKRSTEKRDKPGRPRVLFEAARRDTRSPDAEGYRFLAEVLAGYLKANVEDPAAAAEEAGRVWGHYMVDKPEPFTRPDAGRVVEHVITALAELGFAPDEDHAGGRYLVRLHDCPFRDLARAHTDVVCSVHLGILRGMTEELCGAVVVDNLQPFVGPSLCVANLSVRQ